MTTTIAPPPSLSRTVNGPSMLKLRVLEALDRVTALTLWHELEQRVGDVPLMASEAWTRIWLTHYGETVRYRFLLAEDNGQLRGICLYTESSDRKAPLLSLQTRHLGTAGDPVGESVVVEYNSFLVEPAFRPAFIDAISHWLLTQAGGDIVQLDGFTKEEAHELTAHWPAVETRERESKYLDLSVIRTKGGELIDALGRSTRANLRKRLREYGDLQLEWAETLDTANSIFTELIELHQARWQADGQPGAFASRRFAAFQRALLTELFPQGRCVAFRVRHQGVTVGCLFLLVDRGRMLDYLSGLASFDQKPSPGLVAHYLCQCEALKRGFSAYDFLVGDKRHKDNLSTHCQTLTWTRLVRPTLKNRLVDALTQLKRRLRPLPPVTASPAPTTTSSNPVEQE
jgi:CelD/BcsL family acetyltransferase involved in cellulose biosynthesis